MSPVFQYYLDTREITKIVISVLENEINCIWICKSINLNKKLFAIWLLTCANLVQIKANVNESRTIPQNTIVTVRENSSLRDLLLFPECD